MDNLLVHIFKTMYRCFLRLKYPHHITLHQGAIFNHKTQLGGYNVIHQGTCISGSHIGQNTYIDENCYLPNSIIGSYCSLAKNIKVVLYTHPTSTFVSTSPVFFSTLKQTNKTYVSLNLFDEQFLYQIMTLHLIQLELKQLKKLGLNQRYKCHHKDNQHKSCH